MGKYLLCLSAFSLSQKPTILSKGNVFACILPLNRGLKLLSQNAESGSDYSEVFLENELPLVLSYRSKKIILDRS